MAFAAAFPPDGPVDAAFVPPDAEALETGHWAVERARAEVGDADAHLAEYLARLAQPDRLPPRTETREVDPGEAKRGPDWPEPPDYGRPLTATGQLLTRIDEDIAGSLAARLQRIAEERYARAERGRVEAGARARHAESLLVSERSARQNAQARLVAVEDERDGLAQRLAAWVEEAQRAKARIGELELTVRSLGQVIAHAAGHDTDAKGGGSDG